MDAYELPMLSANCRIYRVWHSTTQKLRGQLIERYRVVMLALLCV